MALRYLQCVLAPESEFFELHSGKMEIQVQCTGPNQTVIPEGPEFLIGPQEVLKCSDDLATDTLLSLTEGLGGPAMFSELTTNLPPATIHVDVDELISELVDE